MKKKIILRIISVFFAAIAVLAAVCAATVTGGGFLDLSNIVRVPCICMAIICAVLSIVMWKCSGKTENCRKTPKLKK